jgi:hypothetical protein
MRKEFSVRKLRIGLNIYVFLWHVDIACDRIVNQQPRPGTVALSQSCPTKDSRHSALNMSPSSSVSSASARSLDSLMSELLSPQGLQRFFLRNRRARYALIGTVAAIVASLAEMKRRAHNQDEVKRKIPHRRNSAVHLYDGSFLLVHLSLTDRLI